jgi:hypothetical protein
MRLAQIEFERQWKEHFGRDEFLQKDDGFYTSDDTALAYFWFDKGFVSESASGATQWHDYDPEQLSEELEDGRWHLIDCGNYIGTSRWCDQRHWLDDDTAVVKRFARVWV